jgi:hypothetical protein
MLTNYFLILYFSMKVETDSSAKQNLYEAFMQLSDTAIV